MADKCPRAGSNLTLKLISKPSRGQKSAWEHRVLELLDPGVPDISPTAQYPRDVTLAPAPFKRVGVAILILANKSIVSNIWHNM